MPLSTAESVVAGSSARLGPYLMEPGSPYDPACRISQQEPAPGAPLTVDLIRVLLECSRP
jgi:hypothetical protein